MDNAVNLPPGPALPRRLAAMVYDSLLVIPLIMGVVAVATAIGVVATGDSGNADYSATVPPLLVQVLAISCVVGFYSYFWCLRGQTLGMQAWRIKLISDQHENVTYRQAGIRCAGALLSLLPGGLGYFWCLFDKERLCWHDRMSGTRLELLPKAKKDK